MQENDIRHVLINVEATKRAEIPDSTLHSILNIALDTVNQPVLIHCNHGRVSSSSYLPVSIFVFIETDHATILQDLLRL